MFKFNSIQKVEKNNMKQPDINIQRRLRSAVPIVQSFSADNMKIALVYLLLIIYVQADFF